MILENPIRQKSVNAIRILSTEQITKANTGHPGICFDAAPTVYTLYADIMKYSYKIRVGGGVAAQKDKLIKPVQKLLDKQIFAGQGYAGVKVVTASLGNKAGVYGAAALNM